ncbi:MAG: T9SS type A sorting domain-containing protein [Saprospiraceae bacterium]
MEAQFTHCEMHSVSGPEFEILCKLGYLTGECKENCLLDAVNDVYTIYTDDITINNTELLANDFAPLATVVSLIPGCGDYGSLTITSVLGGFYIDNLPVGITELCYQIVGCEGKIDQAKIFISVISSVADCNYPETCELIAFGTFEGLSAIEPYSDFILSSALPNGNSPELKVSCYSAAACGPATTICDMASPVSNHFVSFFSSFSKSEGICLPLCAALEVGQSYTFSFWAFAPCNFRLRPSFSVDKPCPKNTGVSVGGVLAPGLVLDPNPAPCSTMPPYSFTATAPWATLNLPATLDFIGLPTWQQFTYTFIAGQPYEFVSLVQFPSGTRSLDLDNISLVKTNTSEVTVSTEIIGCIDGQATIEYTLCSNELITLDLTASFPPSSGIVFSSSGDFIAGMATVTVPDDDCITIQLVFDVANSVADGTNFDVHLLGVVAGLCGNEIDQIDNVAVSIPLPSYAADFLVLKDCPFVQFRHHGSSTGAQHSWDFGDGHTETSPDPLHLFVGLGPFTVTHTVSNHCNSVTFVQEVEGCEEFYCPIEEGTIGIDGRTTPVKLSDLITNNVLPSNFTQYQDFYLAGVLEIDISNYQFDHTNWFCDAGSEIVINGDNIDISNTTLKGCEKMWKGIRLSTGSGLRVSTCTIQDAQYGIEIGDEVVYLICSNTLFDKDYIGIYAEEVGTGLKNFVWLISGNRFYCASTLLDPYIGQTDYPSGFGNPLIPEKITYAGISISDLANFNISGYSSYPGNNIFKGIRNGILGRESNINIRGNTIQDLQGNYVLWPLSTANTTSGFGIKLESILTLDISNNAIKNGYVGAMSKYNNNATIKISNNTLTNFHYNGAPTLYGFGIYTASGNNSKLTLSNNSLSDCGPQIGVFDFSLLSLSIENNTSVIDNTADLGRGIAVSQALCTKPGGSITSNTINMDGDGIGIELWEVFPLSANKNTINLNGPAIPLVLNPGHGIEINSCDAIHVRDNTFNQTVSQTTPYKAVIGRISNNTTFCCNISNDLNQGFYFYGVNPLTNFRSNQMYNNIHGLTLNEGSIGLQIHAGNQWFGTNRSVRILSSSSNYGLIALGSQFKYNSFQPNTVPTTITPSSISLIWFVPDNINSALFCNELPDCGVTPYFLGSGGEEESGDRKSLSNNSQSSVIIQQPLQSLNCDGSLIQQYISIAHGETLGGIYAEQNKWAEQYNLYKILDTIPAFLLANCYVLDSFYHNSDIYESYYAIEKKILVAFQLAPEQQSLSDEAKLTIEYSMAQIDSIYGIVSEPGALIQYINQILVVQEIIKDKTEVLNEINLLVHDKAKSIGYSLQGQILELPEAHYFLHELKEIWIIEAKKLKVGLDSLNQSDWTIINTIADLCPLEYGRAVGIARSLVQCKKLTEFPIVDDVCNGELIENRERKEAEPNFVVYPNPSKGQWELESNFKEKGYFDIIVTNMLGEFIFKDTYPKQINANKIEIPTAPSGIYFLHVQDGGKTIFRQKLILQK